MAYFLNLGNEKFCKDLNANIFVDKTMLIAQTNKLINTNNQIIKLLKFTFNSLFNILSPTYNNAKIYLLCLLVLLKAYLSLF